MKALVLLLAVVLAAGEEPRPRALGVLQNTLDNREELLKFVQGNFREFWECSRLRRQSSEEEYQKCKDKIMKKAPEVAKLLTEKGARKLRAGPTRKPRVEAGRARSIRR